MEKKNYQSPTIIVFTMVPTSLLVGTTVDEIITDDPATEPAMGKSMGEAFDTDLDEPVSGGSHKIWEE